jgi:HSP20 family molecular chaperone IbpA
MLKIALRPCRFCTMQSADWSLRRTPEEALTTTSFAPPVEIYEDEHNIVLNVEVPGIDDKDIDVRIDNSASPSMANARSRRKRKRRQDQ